MTPSERGRGRNLEMGIALGLHASRAQYGLDVDDVAIVLDQHAPQPVTRRTAYRWLHALANVAGFELREINGRMRVFSVE